MELDVDYVGWKSVRNLDVHLSNGGMIPQPENRRNVPVINLGTEYRLLGPALLPNRDLAFRGGCSHTQNPVPDSFFNPAISSFDSRTISTGVGFMCKDGGLFLGVLPCGGGGRSDSKLLPKAIGLDIAYQEWIYEPRTVMGNQNPTVNGTYRTYIHLGMVNLRMLF